MPAVAQRIKLRLFIEGVEIPCISTSVQVAPNSPMMASIQIPPLAEATRFLPRSLVHVFFWDMYAQESDENYMRTGDSLQPDKHSPRVAQQGQDAGLKSMSEGGDVQNELLTLSANDVLDKYKLLFVGELMGFQWSKTATNRSIVLQCGDMSNYWDYAMQFNNSDLFGPGLKAMFSGGATNAFTDFLSSPGQEVVKTILTPPVRYPKMEGLLGGIIHLLETMGGSYYYAKKFHGQNIFFSIAELRLHLTQMITAYPEDVTSKKLLGGGYDALFGRSIGDLGEQASFRKVINLLSGVIFHETYGQPCPRYVPGSGGTVSGSTRKLITRIAPLNNLVAKVRAALADLHALVDSLVEIKDQLKGIDAEKDKPAWRSAQASAVNEQAVKNARDSLSRIVSSCKEIAWSAGNEIPGARAKDNPDVVTLLQQVQTQANAAAADLGTALSRLKTAGAGSSANKANIGIASTWVPLSKSLTSGGNKLSAILALEATTSTHKDPWPALLKQQIMRPDVWFSAPPRCNVIFPDQYNQLNYSRQFMAEPTRLLLKTNDEFFGEDELFDKYFFAPKAVTVKQEKATLQAMLAGDILDHELFTGILPVFEKMGEFNIFAARSGMVDSKVPKVGLAQRSTNFLYFKYRFAPRQLTLSGQFNPYVAPGFPGLIIDKYVDLETFKRQNDLIKSLPNPNNLPLPQLLSMLGTHFLCNFTEVTHSVDQQSATTTLNCSYARQPEESVEFLGNVQDEIEIERKVNGKVATTESKVAAIYAPRVGMQGPGLGRITEVEDITSSERGPDFILPDQTVTSTKELPIYGGPRDPSTKQLSAYAPVGWAHDAGHYSKEVVDMVGDPSIAVMFRAYKVTETIAQTKLERVDLPPEEYIRPGWYGDCWHPSKISAVYYDFFDTGAITEAQQVQNFVGDTSGGVNTSSNAEQTLSDLTSGNAPLKFAQDQLIALSLSKSSNIQQAVAFLVLTYSVIKQAGFSANDFIKTYTWRPIATMLDMFGSQDLQLDQGGKNVVKGIEGFHSRAFGPFDDLFGLVTSDIEAIVGITKGSPQAQKADTRKRKFLAVLAYAAQLRLSKGILG
jgi:hypothetical protein